jgi:hypothetical protein
VEKEGDMQGGGWLNDTQNIIENKCIKLLPTFSTSTCSARIFSGTGKKTFLKIILINVMNSFHLIPAEDEEEYDDQEEEFEKFGDVGRIHTFKRGGGSIRLV